MLTFTPKCLPLLAALPALVAGLPLFRRLWQLRQPPGHVHEAGQALLVAAVALGEFRAADVETCSAGSAAGRLGDSSSIVVAMVKVLGESMGCPWDMSMGYPWIVEMGPQMILQGHAG